MLKFCFQQEKYRFKLFERMSDRLPYNIKKPKRIEKVISVSFSGDALGHVIAVIRQRYHRPKRQLQSFWHRAATNSVFTEVPKQNSALGLH